MKKFIICAFAVLILLVSCAKEPPKEEVKDPKYKAYFTLSFEDPQTVIAPDEVVTYTAVLKSGAEENFTLTHSGELISVYIHKAEDDPAGVPSMAFEASPTTSELEAGGTLSRTYDAGPLEPGNYVIGAHCTFTIDGESYFYEADPVNLTVSAD